MLQPDMSGAKRSVAKLYLTAAFPRQEKAPYLMHRARVTINSLLRDRPSDYRIRY